MPSLGPCGSGTGNSARSSTCALTRVLAGVLFTDIVGSTHKAAEMGDIAWKLLLNKHDALAVGIALRAGVHTGEVEIRGDDVAGLGINKVVISGSAGLAVAERRPIRVTSQQPQRLIEDRSI